jgi:hypothetical protein
MAPIGGPVALKPSPGRRMMPVMAAYVAGAADPALSIVSLGGDRYAVDDAAANEAYVSSIASGRYGLDSSQAAGLSLRSVSGAVVVWSA